MQKAKYNIDRDLYELTTMSLTLEQYVTGDHIYVTPFHKSNHMPTMTLGTFLMRLRRITALQSKLDVGSRAQIQIALNTFNHVLEDWEHHYALKVHNEIEARLNTLNAFFDDLEDSPQDALNDFTPELLVRTAIEELINQSFYKIDIDGTLLSKVDRVDTEWIAVTRDSYFHWDEMLRTVYPSENYWWLYTELHNQQNIA